MEPLDLIWVGRQVCGSEKEENSIEVVLEKTKRRSKVFNKLDQLLNCSLQCHLFEAVKGACLNHDVCWLVGER